MCDLQDHEPTALVYSSAAGEVEHKHCRKCGIEWHLVEQEQVAQWKQKLHSMTTIGTPSTFTMPALAGETTG